MAASARAFDAVEAFKEPWNFGFCNACARIAHREQCLLPISSKTDPDLAIEGEFEGVGQKIEDDLFPHVAVDAGFAGKGRAVDDKA